MALSSSPRKVVPLATGDDWLPVAKPAASGPATVKRVFYCGVVVESTENSRSLPEDVQDLIASLGEPLTVDSDTPLLSLSADNHPDDALDQTRPKAADSSTLLDLINELVSTERSYVRRLQIMKHDYADPLRKFSRNKDTAILPPYEAKTLFGNIDNLLPVNEAFLADLEKMLTPEGPRTVGGVGDVALRHFEEYRGFEFYKGYYDKREEAQAIFLREMNKKSSPFAAFIDRIKYSNADARNRIGLRELLMEPVQRIPRYTLLFRAIIKHMAIADPQRRKLIEADKIASKIALAEADDQTKQAAIWYCLKATVDGFPAGLISHSRRFVDCIDVEDVIMDLSSSSSGPSSASSSLHCTLFLFDDKLLIAKRPGNGEKSGRTLSGLDEMDKLAKSGGLPLGMKKSGMTFKGVVDITDVVAVDVGGADMHIYLEDPPHGQTDRWSGRPFRALSVVHPPSPINFDPTRSEIDKTRFLEHLWSAQAKYRTKAGQSVVLCKDEAEVESRAGRVTFARTYFNLYQRTAFLQESKKTKVVVHIDPLGSADPVPFGMNGPPFVRIRVQPMAGELCRYTVMSNDPNDESEEDIVQTARVPARIVQTVHQFGLFKFRTGNNSAPSTPTASIRSRAHIFGLDAISRNLFNAKSGSSKVDFFGGSINGSRRSKSSVSKSSTTAMTADGSLMKFSSRNSTTTAATSMLSMDEDSFFGGGGGGEKSSSRSRSRTRKLLKKRSKSPGAFGSDGEGLPPRAASRSNPGSRATSEERGLDYSDMDDVAHPLRASREMDESDMDLSLRLELARRNSQSQHGLPPVPLHLEPNVEETIYEEEPPLPVRPASRISREASSRRSSTPIHRPTTPSDRNSSGPFRSTSQISSERRPMGPRAPSPLPRSPLLLPSEMPDIEIARDEMLMEAGPTPTAPTVLDDMTVIHSNDTSVLTGNIDATPKHSSKGTNASRIEPLSIKKKTSVRSNAPSGSPLPLRKTFTRTSPSSRARIVSPRRVSPQIRTMLVHAQNSDISVDVDRAIYLAETTKEDMESSRRAVKRIRLQLDQFQSGSPHPTFEEHWRSSSPVKGLPRTPQRTNTTMTKEAQDRMNEMRSLIGKRLEGEAMPRSRAGTLPSTPTSRSANAFSADNIASTLQELVSDADRDMSRAVSNQEALQDDIRLLADGFRQKSSDMEKARVELQNTKRQCELVKSLLADATAEKEIMYEAFNEELDSMYQDANLPEDEAWSSMAEDLRKTKESRNALAKENSQLKRRLAEVECQQEEWAGLLRSHGLIS